MAVTKGRKAFEKYFSECQQAVDGRLGRTVQKALDPATITMIISAILEGLKICFRRDGEQATIQRIKNAGGLNAGQAYRALLKGGYEDDERPRERRRLCREMAEEMTAKTGRIPAEDLEAFLNDVRNTPEPPAEIEVTGTTLDFWGILLAVGFLLIGSMASAGDTSATGLDFWSVEAEVKAIREDVDRIDERLSRVETLVAKVETSSRSTEGMVEKLVQHFVPEAICTPQLPSISIGTDKAEPIQPADPIQSLQASVDQMMSEIQSLKAQRSVASVPARSYGTSVTLPAGTRRARVRFRGRDIDDVSAFIRANPCKTVGIAPGWENRHLVQHGYSGDFTGLSYDQKIRLHSIAHNYTVPSFPASSFTVTQTSYAPSEATVEYAPSRTYVSRADYGCVGGSCSRGYASATVSSGRRRGPIMRLFFGG